MANDFLATIIYEYLVIQSEGEGGLFIPDN